MITAKDPANQTQRGGITLMMLVLMAFAFAASALVFDAGMAAVARSEAADAAASLARAGANAVSLDTGGSGVSQSDAETRIQELSQKRWPSLTWHASYTPAAVTVTVETVYENRILDDFGVADTEISVTSVAQVEQ